jgi:nucleoside-diphosphate-sugar epimerase
MKVLFIGGTGIISTAISKLMVENGHELYLLNRGNREIPGAQNIICDINNEDVAREKLAGMSFDIVADFIAFKPEQVMRDYRLFAGKTRQYIFISSASAYQKPLSDFRVNEGTPLSNPYWQYSRDKIACEEFLMQKYREEGFPITIIRPSHTYDERSIPLGVHGKNGSWQVAKRMLVGKPVVIHGDGTSLWTMTHNSDFAVAFCGLCSNIKAIGESVQITSDEVLTWNQIYQSIADALNVKLNAIHVSSEFLASCSDYDFTGSLLGDKANSVAFDNTKLKKLVPYFTPKKRFSDGIKETVEYVLAHPELQADDPEFDDFCDRLIEVMQNAKSALIVK